MTLSKQILGLMMATALMSVSAPQRAQSQNIGGVLDLMGRAIEQDMQRKQLQREQAYEEQQRREQEEAYRRQERAARQQEERRQQAEADAQREQEIALIRRAQSALAKLGFYRSKADGDRGPGTRAAEAAYRAAFDLTRFDPTEAEVQRLEQYAATGFRSLSELQRASEGRFSSRADLAAAEAGGFDNASQLLDARRLGIKTRQTYDAFRNSGFTDVQTFLVARKGGFDDPAEFAAAKEQGFANRDDYRKFQASGLASRQLYLEAQAQEAKRQKAHSTCVVGPAGFSEPVKAVEVCLTAIQLGSGDTALRAAFADLGEKLALRRAELAAGNLGKAPTEVASTSSSDDAKDAQEGASSDTPSIGAAAFLSELADIDAALLAHACGLSFVTDDFAKAELQCRPSGNLSGNAVLAALQTSAAEKASAARKVAEAEAERLRREAVAEQQRLALASARTRASELLKNIGEFTAARRTLNARLDVAKAVVAVRQNETGSDVTVLQQANGRLEALLAKEVDFQAFLEERVTAERVAVVNARTTATAEVERLRAFIEQYVGENILSDRVDDLLTLQAKLADAAASNDLERIVRAQKEGGEQIEAFGLQADLNLFTVPVAASETTADSVEEAANGLAITPLNQALLQGEARDVLILGNYTPDAPHLVINLLGETVFDGRIADFCWYGQPASQTPTGRLALEKLKGLGADEMRERGSCTSPATMSHDVVLLQRGEFLASDVLAARKLVDAFEKEDLRLLATIAWTQVGKVAETETQTADEIEADVLAGLRQGFGFVGFDNPANRICLVVAEADRQAQEAVITDTLPRIDRFLKSNAEKTSSSLEEAFVRVQRQECSAIYANQSDLKTLLDGLKRAKLDYAVVPVWVGPQMVADAKGRLSQDSDIEQKAIAARKQEMEASQRLAAAKANEAGEVRRRAQAAMRDRYGQEAKAAFNGLSELGDAFFRGQSQGQGQFSSLFPEVALGKSQRDADDWAVETYNSELVDYGTAEWKGRRAEVVFAELKVRSKNRELGEYADECFLVGYLIDAEFSVVRDPVSGRCSDASGLIEAWKAGRGFDSRWISK